MAEWTSTQPWPQILDMAKSFENVEHYHKSLEKSFITLVMAIISSIFVLNGVEFQPNFLKLCQNKQNVCNRLCARLFVLTKQKFVIWIKKWFIHKFMEKRKIGDFATKSFKN